MKTKRLPSLSCVALFASCLFCYSAASASAATLNGAGSTLVAPIEAEWGAAWSSATGNSVTYQSVGSGTGYKDIAAGLVDFGASDAPMSAYATACNGCVQIPWALSATGVSFHLGGISSLHMTGPVLAQIYLGQITKWNDHRITSLNRGKHLPNLPITVFWRNDGSGDTYAFTRYLSDVSSSFSHTVGSATTVSWPVGHGAKGNSGMVSALQGTNGGIAYVAVSYLLAHQMPAIAIKNAAGRYTVPNLSNIEAAAAAVHHVPSNNQVTIVNPPRSARSAYVISTFTYVIVPTHPSQASALKSFIYYALTGGQQFAPALDFAPLPRVVANAAKGTINAIH